jgi:autotransporter-associated beta strand protein
LFTIGNQTTTETNMTVFAHGGPRVIDNPIFLDGAQNVNVTGDHDLTLKGAISAGGVAKKWTVQGTGVATLSGQITASGAGAPLTKAGLGTLALAADNLYWGATTIQEGTLLANNTAGSATGTNAVSIRSGAALGGTGYVAGPVTATGGSVAPGQDGAGTLSLAGGVDLSNGGIYLWDLAANSTDPGTFDVLAVTGGNVVLGGTSQIQVNFTGLATAPDETNPFWQSERTWTILTVNGASNPGLTKFQGVANGITVAGRFTNETDASGNIVLRFTPGETEQPFITTTIEDLSAGNPTLTWSATDGLTYQLQYKTNLSMAGWLLAGEVTANGATASMTHTNALYPQCFYRVVIVR